LGCFRFVAVEGLRGGVEALEQGGGHGGADDVICHVPIEEEDGKQARGEDQEGFFDWVHRCFFLG
jgi:hypothetical protein